MNKTKLLVLAAAILSTLLISPVFALFEEKLPDHFGFFATTKRILTTDLTELQPQPYSRRRGDDGLKTLSNVTLESVDELIVYDDSASWKDIALYKVFNYRESRTWTAYPRNNLEITVSPLEGKANMCRVVPERSLRQGVYALIIKREATNSWMACDFIVGSTDLLAQMKDSLTELTDLEVPYDRNEFVMRARQGDTNAVELFLSAGMDPNVKNQYNDPALFYAAWKGHMEIVRILLKYGADASLKNGMMAWTPLSRAAAGGHAEIAGVLIKHGADVDARDLADETPILSAAKNGHTEIVKLLKEAGAKE